jgi:anti-sigma regulatory factor (Ser/Thr protein kinase)
MSGRLSDARPRGNAVRAPAERAGTVQLMLRASPENLALVRLTVGAVATLGGAPPAVTADLKLAVTEACTNAVRHAYPDGSSQDPKLTITVALEPGQLTVDVADQGIGFDPDRVSLIIYQGEEREHGMGLPIIQALTDTLDIYPLKQGTRLVFSKSFTRSQPPD